MIDMLVVIITKAKNEYALCKSPVINHKGKCQIPQITPITKLAGMTPIFSCKGS